MLPCARLSLEMRRIPEAILNAAPRLFWDVELQTLDPERHEHFILGRVLSERFRDKDPWSIG